MITMNHSSNCGSFYLKAEARLAVAELTNISDEVYHYGVESHNQLWYFFNRISVPQPFAIQHASILIMKEVVTWADQNQINIIDTLNPYGRLNLNQLRKFNMLFGFRNVPGQYKSLMIRHYHETSDCRL